MSSHSRYIFALALAVLTAGVLLGLRASDPEPEITLESRCGLIAAYDSIIVMPSGNALEVTEATRPALLENVRSCVETLLTPELLDQYKRADALLAKPVVTNQDRADRDLIRVEIAAQIADDATIRQQQAVAHRIAGGSDELALAVRRQNASSVLQSAGWTLDGLTDAPRHDASKYVQDCRAADVPVPKSMREDPGWSTPKTLDTETERYLILREKRVASVWTYTDSAGGYCITLKRQNPDVAGEIPLIGTICTNPTETSACFFDNLVSGPGGTKKRLTLDEFSGTDLSSLLHPVDGNDDCSTCHLGTNPFLVDPKTLLGQTIKSHYGGATKGHSFQFAGFDSARVKWTNFSPIDGKPAGTGCMSCHDIPHITKEHRFCSAIIQRAANTTMPPGYWDGKPKDGRKELWPGTDGCFDRNLADLSEYFASLRQIKAVCTGEKVRECPNADGLVRQ